MAPRETKERILDTAEALFAEQGFAAASMRAITSAAEVNLASVHYHFGSKEALIAAVFERRIAPLNRERIERLERVEQASGEAAPAVEDIVEAFVTPALRLRDAGHRRWPVIRRLLGQTISAPEASVRHLFTEQFREVVGRFTTALQRALPQLSKSEIFWRFTFMVGAMAHTMAMADDMGSLSGGHMKPADVDTTVRRLVPFLAAGFGSPIAVEEGVEVKDA